MVTLLTARLLTCQSLRVASSFAIFATLTMIHYQFSGEQHRSLRVSLSPEMTDA